MHTPTSALSRGISIFVAAFLMANCRALSSSGEEVSSWGIASGEPNGLPLIIRYRSTLPDSLDPADFPTHFSIVAAYTSTDEDQLPGSADIDSMNTFEDMLFEALEGSGAGYLTSVTTTNGTREWQLYTSDPEVPPLVISQYRALPSSIPLECTSETDPTWSAFHDLLRSLE